MLTLAQLCRELSISPATGRNWIKLGKIKAMQKHGRSFVFPEEYVEQLKAELSSGKRTALKSRRNKTFITGKALYRDYVSAESKNIPIIDELISSLSDMIQSEGEAPESSFDELSSTILLRSMLADCVIKLILDKNQITGTEDQTAESGTNHLEKYLNGDLPLFGFEALVDDLIGEKDDVHLFAYKYSHLFPEKYIYEPGEDIPGLLYISLKNSGLRKKAGEYFTPTKIVKRLLGHLFEAALMTDGQDKKILDPCCGSGNFLLQLPPGIPMENIFGCDIDRLSVALSRINLAMKYGNTDSVFWEKHIVRCNFLVDAGEITSQNFDVILGNPPWGFLFSDAEKKQLGSLYETAKTEAPESFDIFVEQGINTLATDGILSYVLPQSIMSVRSHKAARSYILRNTSLSQLDYLGDVFDRVQCPAIILQLKKNEFAFANVPDTGEYFLKNYPKIYEDNSHYVIKKERLISDESFNFIIPDDEYMLINKIENTDNASYLKDNAVFALGIVTGSNKEMLKTRKSNKNEIILKGQDIFKFSFRTPKCYINFIPENCQQVAPTAYYRAPEKLLYRFIGDRLVFAYDDHQTLSLNSCNVLIPQLQHLSIKYILAVLNSRTAEYYFRKKFRSVKILRSHLEQIPIPNANVELQEKIIRLTDSLIANDSSSDKIFEELDVIIAVLYGLTEDEYEMIKNEFSSDTLFLQNHMD